MQDGQKFGFHRPIFECRKHRIFAEKLSQDTDSDLVHVQGGMNDEQLLSLLHYVYSGIRIDAHADVFVRERNLELDESQFFADVLQLRKLPKWDLSFFSAEEEERTLIPVHKFVVSARCHAMSRMFSPNFAEFSQSEIRMSEAKVVLEALLDYMYSDTAQFEGDTVLEVLEAGTFKI